MIANALQTAREVHLLEERTAFSAEIGFDDNPFVRSVLDPNMFNRYNDGILQASMLRACQRSELDYSASEDLSKQFTSSCKSILEGHKHDLGDAALEYVHALATNKVSLCEDDTNRLMQTISNVPVLNALYNVITHEGNFEDDSL